jgi:hypothetical protein
MKKFTVTITSHSTAGSSVKKYRSQLVEVEDAPDVVVTGADEHVINARQNIRVFWTGGKAFDLKNATRVALLDENRGFALEGELSSTAGPPRNVSGGVELFLVRIKIGELGHARHSTAAGG